MQQSQVVCGMAKPKHWRISATWQFFTLAAHPSSKGMCGHSQGVQIAGSGHLASAERLADVEALALLKGLAATEEEGAKLLSGLAVGKGFALTFLSELGLQPESDTLPLSLGNTTVHSASKQHPVASLLHPCLAGHCSSTNKGYGVRGWCSIRCQVLCQLDRTLCAPGWGPSRGRLCGALFLAATSTICSMSAKDTSATESQLVSTL